MVLNERLKKLRKALDLTQREFGERIGVKPNTIATYEIGRNEPIDAVVSLICREFHVNEHWLRTGEGEMFKPEPVFDLGDYVKRHGMTALETEILKAYLELDPAVREKLLQHFKDRLTRSAAPPTTGQKGTEGDMDGHEGPKLDWRGQPIDMAAIDEEVELYRQRLLQEKKQASQTSAAKEPGAG